MKMERSLHVDREKVSWTDLIAEPSRSFDRTPATRNPKPQTPNAKPQTQTPKP